VVRVMAGGHFASDVIFAGVLTLLLIWIGHGLIYRWPRTRLSDAGVERAIERIAMPGYQLIAGLFGKRNS
jgi:lipid A 4'-phosphatase